MKCLQLKASKHDHSWTFVVGAIACLIFFRRTDQLTKSA